MHPRIIPRGSRRAAAEVRGGERKTPGFFAKRAGQPSYPSNAEKVFPTPRGFRRRWRLAAMAERQGGGGGGWQGGTVREGVDLSCQTLAPRGGGRGFLFATTTTTGVRPKVSNRDSGFWGSFPSPFLRLYRPPIRPVARSLARRSSCLGPLPSSLSLALHLVTTGGPANRRRRDYALPSHVFAPSGAALETEFRNLHICRPGARARASGPYILTIFSRKCERGSALPA